MSDAPSRLRPAPSYPIATDHVTVEIRQDRRRPSGRLVLMDGVEASHVDLEDPTRIEFEYLRHVVSLLDRSFLRTQAVEALQIGGGPCTLARQLTATRPKARITVVERDAALIDLAREWLGLRTGARLRVVVGEGRAELERRPPRSIDILVVDAFEGVMVPHRLLTEEFVEHARRSLRDGGLHIVNLIDVAPLGLATAAVATLRAAYPHALLLADRRVLDEAASGNVVLAASDRPFPVDGLRRQVGRDAAPWKVVAGRELERLIRDAPVLSDAVRPDHGLALLAPLWGRSWGSRARGGPADGPAASGE